MVFYVVKAIPKEAQWEAMVNKFRPGISQPIHPIIYKNSRKGILLLHGFTATPECFHFLAKKLSDQNLSVYAPILAGHGTKAEDLEKTKWGDWYDTAEKSLNELQKYCDSVSVLGLSMGGLLTLHLAHQHPEIKSISLLATPLFLDGFLLRYLFPLIWKTPLKYLYRYQRKYVASIKDPEAQRKYQTYEKIPVASVANLLDLQKKVRQELHGIKQPTFIAHALDDSTVPYANMDYIASCIGSKVVETLTLKKSNHIITIDYDKDEVAKRVIKFLKKN